MSLLLEQVLSSVDRLAPAERQQLMDHLIAQMNPPIVTPPKAKRKLSDFYGVAPNLLEGVDAQEWVSRSRQEWSDREETLRPIE
jgi:hypothetical protein